MEPPARSRSRQVRKYRRASGQQASCPQMGSANQLCAPSSADPGPPGAGWLRAGWSSPSTAVCRSCFIFACQGRLCLPPVTVTFNHPTPVLLPGKSHGWRSLVGCSPWGREEADRTERVYFHFSLLCIGEGNGNPLQCSCLENPGDGVS